MLNDVFSVVVIPTRRMTIQKKTQKEGHMISAVQLLISPLATQPVKSGLQHHLSLNISRHVMLPE